MSDKRTKIFGLKELELTNDDLFVRKPITGNFDDVKVIIDETHVAIVLQNGIALETYRPGMYSIDNKKSAFSKSIDETLRLELFYISKTAKIRVLWGTPSLFDIHDPNTDVPAKMGASGEMEIRVLNPRQFYIELVGANKKFTVEDLKERLKGLILARIEPTVNDFIESERVSLDRLGEEKMSIANKIKKDLAHELGLNYGLEVSNFIVSNINVVEKYKDKVSIKQQEAKCPRCGSLLTPGSKFCNNCGARVQ